MNPACPPPHGLPANRRRANGWTAARIRHPARKGTVLGALALTLGMAAQAQPVAPPPAAAGAVAKDPATGLAAHAHLPFTFEPQARTAVQIVVVKDKVVARLPSGAVQVLADAISSEERGGAPWVLRGDFNYDGADDLAVLESQGYGGVNSYRVIALWQPAAGRFERLPEPISNPDLVPARKAVVSSQRDGPFWTATEYRLGPQGQLYAAVAVDEQLAEGVTQLTFRNPQGRVTGRRLAAEAGWHIAPEDRPPAVLPVLVDKAPLFDRPDAAARNRMYLIKGDRVTLLDTVLKAGQPMGGERWFRIRFQGTRVIESWIDGTALQPR